MYHFLPLPGSGGGNGNIASRGLKILFVGSGWPFGEEFLVERGEDLSKALPGVMPHIKWELLRKPCPLLGRTVRCLELLEVRKSSSYHHEQSTYQHWWFVSECE